MNKIPKLISLALLALALVLPGTAMAQLLDKVPAAYGNYEIKEQNKDPHTAYVLPPRQHTGMERISVAGILNVPAVSQMSVPRHAAASVNVPDLRGNVITGTAGVYKVATSTPELLFTGPKANGGAVMKDGFFQSFEYQYSAEYDSYLVKLQKYDAETGEYKGMTYAGKVNIATGGTAVDPTDGQVYAITLGAMGGMQLVKMAFGTYGVSQTTVAALDGSWAALACDAQGQLYGISYEADGPDNDFTVSSSTLKKINKETGATTIVGNTGELPRFISSAVIDTRSGRMFWNVCPSDGTSWLTEVDLATGQASRLFQYDGNEQIVGMYVVEPLAEAGAPAVATDLTLNFPEGSLSGTVSFTAPSTLFNGTKGSGDISYKVTVNNKTVAQGTTQYGAVVVANVTLTKGGNTKFNVITSNSDGESPVATAETFVGHGVPVAPDPTLEYDKAQKKVILTWEPVTTTIDGGYIDPAAVKYNVTRYPDEVVVGQNLTETTFSEILDLPETLTRYYYTVEALSGSSVSFDGESNSVLLGYVTPPYLANFNDENALQPFTVIDNNGDGITWEFSEKEILVMYSRTQPTDDYLLTPPLKLEGGKVYKILFYAHSYSDRYPEKFEVKWGKEPTVEGLNKTLIEPTTIQTTTPQEFSALLVAEESDIYYVAIHGISDAYQYGLYVDDLGIYPSSSIDSPDVCTDIVITPDANGLLKTHVSFKAPTTDFSGNTLEENLQKVTVSRFDDVVKTFINVAPGAELEFDDNLPYGGMVYYYFEAENKSGIGEAVEVPVFVGLDVPAAPTNVKIEETSTLGQVKISWDAVNKDKNGNDINPNLVVYTIAQNMYGEWLPIREGVTGTSTTFQAIDPEVQQYVQYAVYALTTGGMSEQAVTPIIPVGEPYTSVLESFSACNVSYGWAMDYFSTTGRPSWFFANDEYMEGVASQDADNGYLGMSATSAGAYASFISGKISLEGIVEPGVSMYVFNLPNAVGENVNSNEVQLFAKEAGASEWTKLGEPVVIKELGTPGKWYQISESLEGFASKTVLIRVQVTAKVMTHTFIDNIKVGTMLANDLEATAITAPEKANCGKNFGVTVDIANLGSADAKNFKVNLFADNELVQSKTVDKLAANTKASIAFSCPMSAIITEAISLYATVEYEADQNTSNNTTQTTAVVPVAGILPAVSGLKADAKADGVVLTWNQPDLTTAPYVTTTVDFEGGEPFKSQYEGWTFVDGDNAAVGGFQTMDIPGITPGETATSFFLFDYTMPEGSNTTFAAHSGNRYLASLYRYDGGAVDDWAISPALNGMAQTISFWAKSYNSYYPEKMQIVYSNTGTAVEDFILVKEVGAVPMEWTQYSFDVPEGAKYFAIRNCGSNSSMLLVDDVTFVAEGAKQQELTIKGYDVYCNGSKVNEALCTTTNYTDTPAGNQTRTYNVICVYTTGISAPSDNLVVNTTGIDRITIDASDAEYFNLQGIKVENPQKGEVYILRQGSTVLKIVK